MTKPHQNNNSKTFENKMKNTNKHKLLKSILAASSLAAISFGGGNAFASDLDALTGDFTIQAAAGGAAYGVPSVPDNLKAAGANANFAGGDNVKFGAPIIVTNVFEGNVGIINFDDKVGTWNQNEATAVRTIAEVKANAGTAGILNINQNTAVTKADGDALVINVAAGKALTFGNNDQLFGTLNLVAVGSRLKFSGDNTMIGNLTVGVDNKGLIYANDKNITWTGNIGTNLAKLGELKIGDAGAGKARTFEYNVGAGADQTIYVGTIKLNHDDSVLKFTTDAGKKAVVNGNLTVEVDANSSIDAKGGHVKWTGDIGTNIKKLKELSIGDVGGERTFEYNVGAGADQTIYVGTIKLNHDDSVLKFTTDAGKKAVVNGNLTVEVDANSSIDAKGGHVKWTGNIGTNAEKLKELSIGDAGAGKARTFEYNVGAGADQTIYVGTIKLNHDDSVLKFTTDAGKKAVVNGNLTVEVDANSSIDAKGGHVKWTGNIGTNAEKLKELSIGDVGGERTFGYGGGAAYINELTFGHADSVLEFSGAGSFTVTTPLAANKGIIKSNGDLAGGMEVAIDTSANKLKSIDLSHTAGTLKFASAVNTTGAISINSGGATIGTATFNEAVAVDLGDVSLDGKGNLNFVKTLTLTNGNVTLAGASAAKFKNDVTFTTLDTGFAINDENSKVEFDLDGDRTIGVNLASTKVFDMGANLNYGTLSVVNTAGVANKTLSFVGNGLTKISNEAFKLVEIGDKVTLELGARNLSAAELKFIGDTPVLSVDASGLAANGDVTIAAVVKTGTDTKGTLDYTVAADKHIIHTGVIGTGTHKIGKIDIKGGGNGTVTFTGAVNTAVLDTAAGTVTTFAVGPHNLGAVTNAGTLTFAGGNIGGTIDGGKLNAFGTYKDKIGDTAIIDELRFAGVTTFEKEVKATETHFVAHKVTFKEDSNLGNVTFAAGSNVDIGSKTIEVGNITVNGASTFAINVDAGVAGKIVAGVGSVTTNVGNPITLNITPITVVSGEYIIADNTDLFEKDTTINVGSAIHDATFTKLKVVAPASGGGASATTPKEVISAKFEKNDKKVEVRNNSVIGSAKDQGASVESVQQTLALLDVTMHPEKNPELAAQLSKSETHKQIQAIYANPDADLAALAPAVSPKVVAAQATTTSVTNATSSIGNRLGEITAVSGGIVAAPSAGEELDGNQFGVWGAAHTNKADQKKDGSTSAYKLTGAGGTIGADVKADLNGKEAVFGGAFTFDNGDMKYKGSKSSDKTTVNTNIFSLYSNVDLDRGLFAKGIVSYGTSKVKANTARNGLTAKADYTSKFMSTQIEGGYNHAIDNTNIFATVGGRYINIRNPEYKETGAGAFNQTVRKSNSNQFDLIGSVGVNTVILSGETAFIPNAKFSISEKVSGKTPDTKYVVGDLPVEFTNTAAKTKSTYGEFSGGLNVKHSNIDFGVKASYGFAKKFSNVGGALTLRAEF